MKLITNSGREIECIAVINSEIYNYLEIITGSITTNEIFSIFTNPEETKKLTIIDDNYSKTYKGFTWFDSLNRTTIYTGNLDFSIKLRPQYG